MRRRASLLRPHRLSRRHPLHPEYCHHWSRVSPDGWPPNEDADIISDGKHEALQLSGGQYDRYLDVASRSSIRCGAVDQHLRSGKFTHGKYWALDVEGKHITALRKAVNLLDDPSADLTQYEATAARRFYTAQGEQRRPFFFNIDRDNSGARGAPCIKPFSAHR